MTLVEGGRCGPDGIGGAYPNSVQTDRTITWYGNGAQSGVLKGMGISAVSGSMALDVAPGACLVAERDASNVELDRGYLVWSDTTTRVTFGPASVSARNDALVAAFVDTESGPVGTGGLDVGAHVVVVPGVSGTSTPRTDAQITAWLGRGGWHRLADVPIASSDTQINVTTLAGTAYQALDSGGIANAFTAATGWSMIFQNLRRFSGHSFYFQLTVQRTGANITGASNGNIANSVIATFDSTVYPVLFGTTCCSGNTGRGAFGQVGPGNITLAAVAGTNDVATGDQIQLGGVWYG